MLKTLLNNSTSGGGKTNPFERNLNNPTSTFVVVIILCVVLSITSILLFSCLRTKLKRLYSPRLLLEEKMFPLGKLPSSFFAWISPAFMVNDDDLFGHIGMDSLVYLRFLRMAMKIAVFTLPFGLIVLLPLNYHGGWNLKEGLDRISMSNVKIGSRKHWAHFLAVWIYSFGVFYLMYEEWKVYVLYRQAHLAKGLGKHYALLVRDIPRESQDEDSFRGYVDELFPGKISRTHLIQDLDKWDKLVAKHNKLVRKLEHAKAESAEEINEDSVRTRLLQSKGTQVMQLERKLQILQVQLEEEQASVHDNLSCGIVVYRSLSSRSIALQVLWDVQAAKYVVSKAPDSCEIIWKNLKMSPGRRHVRYILANTLVLILILFWALPVAFVASLTKLQSIAQKLTFLERISKDMSKIAAGVVQGMVPVLLIVIFFAILPKILEVIAKFEGSISQSQVQLKVFRGLSIFNIVNTFFVFIIAGSVFQQLEDIILQPANIPKYLGRSLPNQANFYINYVAFLAFCMQGLELTRIVPLIFQSIKLKWFAKTRRERLEAWKPDGPAYAEMYSNDILVFLIGLTYSILSPIIIPFVTIYFAYAYIVWSYQMLHVYLPKYEHGGTFWPLAFNRMVLGTLVFQLLMIGVFSVKKSFEIAVCLAPLPILTVIYWRFVTNKFQRVGEHLALREGKTTRDAYDRFLEKVTSSYIRNQMVPGLYDLSFEDDVYLNNGQGYTPIDNDAVETNHEMQIKVNQMEEDLSTRSSSVRLESP